MASANVIHKVLAKKTTLCSMVCLLSMSACGGGSGGDQTSPSSSTATPSSIEATEMAGSVQTGTVVIEQRRGKTVFDAWFGTEINQNIGTFPANVTGDVCKVLDHSLLTTMPTTLQADTTVSVTNALGSINLTPNQSGSVTVYATDARWSDNPVTNDTVLSFNTASEFSDLSPVQLSELLSFEWIVPNTGALSNIAGSMQWEPTQGDNTRIEINLSTSNATSTSETTVTVVCSLIDDGEFVLSAETQQALGDGDTTVLVRGLRIRQKSIESDGIRLAVVHIGHEI